MSPSHSTRRLARSCIRRPFLLPSAKFAVRFFSQWVNNRNQLKEFMCCECKLQFLITKFLQIEYITIFWGIYLIDNM